jgi:hypothetical protein
MRDRYDLTGQFIRVGIFFAAMVLMGIVLMVALGHAQMQCNCGPNTQTSQPPINSPVQSIHPK